MVLSRVLHESESNIVCYALSGYIAGINIEHDGP